MKTNSGKTYKNLTCAKSIIICRKRGCLAACFFKLPARGLPNDFISNAPNFATGNIILLVSHSLMHETPLNWNTSCLLSFILKHYSYNCYMKVYHWLKCGLCFGGGLLGPQQIPVILCKLLSLQMEVQNICFNFLVQQSF